MKAGRAPAFRNLSRSPELTLRRSGSSPVSNLDKGSTYSAAGAMMDKLFLWLTAFGVSFLVALFMFLLFHF
jgi:hypothetical protein